MNTLFFTHQHRRSTKTLRLQYGLDGMKYIIQVYEGEINGHGEKENLPNEHQYEFEQEMLKHFHDLKNDLRERGWWERETPEVSQTSSLRIENSDGQLLFDYEKNLRDLLLSLRIFTYLPLRLMLLNRQMLET